VGGKEYVGCLVILAVLALLAGAPLALVLGAVAAKFAVPASVVVVLVAIVAAITRASDHDGDDRRG
jgi:hypothetical protein